MAEKVLNDKEKIEQEVGHKICGHITKKGSLCKNIPASGSEFCPLHLEKTKNEVDAFFENIENDKSERLNSEIDELFGTIEEIKPEEETQNEDELINIDEPEAIGDLEELLAVTEEIKAEEETQNEEELMNKDEPEAIGDLEELLAVTEEIKPEEETQNEEELMNKDEPEAIGDLEELLAVTEEIKAEEETQNVDELINIDEPEAIGEFEELLAVTEEIKPEEQTQNVDEVINIEEPETIGELEELLAVTEEIKAEEETQNKDELINIEEPEALEDLEELLAVTEEIKAEEETQSEDELINKDESESIGELEELLAATEQKEEIDLEALMAEIGNGEQVVPEAEEKRVEDALELINEIETNESYGSGEIKMGSAEDEIPIMDLDDKQGGDFDDLESILGNIDENTDISNISSKETKKPRQEENIMSAEDTEELMIFENADSEETKESPAIAKEEKKDTRIKKEKKVKTPKPPKAPKEKKNSIDMKYLLIKHKYKIALLMLFLLSGTTVMVLFKTVLKKEPKVVSALSSENAQKENAEQKEDQSQHQQTAAVEHKAVEEHPTAEVHETTHETPVAESHGNTTDAHAVKEENSHAAEQPKDKGYYLGELNKKINALTGESDLAKRKEIETEIEKLKKLLSEIISKENEEKSLKYSEEIKKILSASKIDIVKVNGPNVSAALALNEGESLKESVSKEKIEKDIVETVKLLFEKDKEVNIININILAKDNAKTSKISKKIEVTSKRYEFDKIDFSKYTNKQILSMFDYYEK